MRTTLDSFRNRATLNLWIFNQPLATTQGDLPVEGRSKHRSPKWIRDRYFCEHCDLSFNTPGSLWGHLESPEHKRNLLCFPSHANILNTRGAESYKSCPFCLSMTPRGDWEEHKASRKHVWKEQEVKEGLSWGSIAKECFNQNWRDFTPP